MFNILKLSCRVMILRMGSLYHYQVLIRAKALLYETSYSIFYVISPVYCAIFCELLSGSMTSFSINGTIRSILPLQEAYDLIFEKFSLKMTTRATKSQDFTYSDSKKKWLNVEMLTNELMPWKIIEKFRIFFQNQEHFHIWSIWNY